MGIKLEKPPKVQNTIPATINEAIIILIGEKTRNQKNTYRSTQSRKPSVIDQKPKKMELRREREAGF